MSYASVAGKARRAPSVGFIFFVHFEGPMMKVNLVLEKVPMKSEMCISTEFCRLVSSHSF